MKMTSARLRLVRYIRKHREMGLFQKAITRSEFNKVLFAAVRFYRYVNWQIPYTAVPGHAGELSMHAWSQPHRLPKPADVLAKFIAFVNNYYRTECGMPPTAELRAWLDTAHIDDAGFLRWTQPTEDTTNEHSG